MKAIQYITAALAIAASAFTASAQGYTTPGLEWSSRHGIHYEVNAGLNIGGASPIPLPAEIRKIDSYNPNLNLMIGATATKWIEPTQRWGVSVGIRFETKGMKTGATVKNYGMEIIQDGSRVKGNWTGKVQTKYSSTQLCIPILANYRINSRWRVNFGPYIALALNNDFSGKVHDGYLREGNPTGNKVVFEGDSEATYDFSDEIRLFQWGLQAGGSWLAFRHLAINANLTWGLNNIFNSSFKTVSFDLYPIYLNLGFGYAF